MSYDGEFERLMEDITTTLREAEGGYRIGSFGNLVIDTQISDRPELSNNGGHYDYYRKYRPDGLGVKAWDDWSCDFYDYQNSNDQYYNCIISLEGLERMAKLATLTIAAESWIKKEPGCMAKLKEAIKALA